MNMAWNMKGLLGVLLFGIGCLPAMAAAADKSPPIKIAVFAFELDDVSPAASLPGESARSAAIMENVTNEARRVLAQSGRYSLVDVSKADAKPVMDNSLRNCGGCEAGVALRLGARQALIGVVTRATQTDYYVLIQTRDARTGKILDQQQANFAGSDEAWASGARMLIKHGILGDVN